MSDLPLEDDRPLNFHGLLAQLQSFVGRRVVIESLDRAGHAYHESEGVLERSVDTHVDLPMPLDRPALIAFYLDTGSKFVLREREVGGARTYTVVDPDDGWTNRIVHVEFAQRGELIVRDAWESEFLEHWQRGERKAP